MSSQNFTSALMCPSQPPPTCLPVANYTSPLDAIGTSCFLPSYTSNQTAFDSGTMSGLSYTTVQTCPTELPSSYLPSANSTSPLNVTGTSCLRQSDKGHQTAYEILQASLNANIRRRRPKVKPPSPTSSDETVQTTGSLSLNDSSSTSDPVAMRAPPIPSFHDHSSRDWRNTPQPPFYDELANRSNTVALQPQLRMVLLGERGVGKSSCGNTILGRPAFETRSGTASRTQLQTGEEAGRQLHVIDSPAVFAAETFSDSDQQEIRRCINLCEPGPHVFLLVMRLDKHGKMEEGAGRRIQEAFGRRALRYTMVLFTHGELLGGRPAEEHLRKSLELVGECGGGHHIFNNKASDDRDQVIELLQKIDKMVLEKRGSYYNVLQNKGGHYSTSEQVKIDWMDRMDRWNDRLESARRDWMDNEGFTGFPVVFAVLLALLMLAVGTLWSKFE